ncbi:HGxxPAAW family protein [Streptomyces sp. NPDC047028]|uniref:HGxxPAAW family protein n=1 Tax=Streptomyces sp. NPDC047028 TaxID=3155793 RepID=UPI0034083432
MSAHLYDEGHTIAGWTGFGIATAGTGLVGLGICTTSLPVVAGGLVVLALSLLTTWFLHLAGWGKPPGGRPRDQWSLRVRDSAARAGHPGCVGCRLAGRGRLRTDGQTAAIATAADEPVVGESIPLSSFE